MTAVPRVQLNHLSYDFEKGTIYGITGKSGAGKTMLLSVLAGLAVPEGGKIIYEGKDIRSMDKYKFRSRYIGVVFQEFNLLTKFIASENVMLSMDIAGVKQKNKKQTALSFLESVGLSEDEANRRVLKLSGGQQQRVAIARALSYDPYMIFADEPTGALDSDTSVQVMEMLEEVAKDRLVIMVTHNPELAEQYATRIVRVKDGKIVDDSEPCELAVGSTEPPKHNNMGKSSMSFLTSLSLSFNNLRNKKGRTLLTFFAGSIGIIGIALILALSNGVNSYIDSIQKSTMTSYPISIEAQSFDMSSMMEMGRNQVSDNDSLDHDLNGIYSNTSDLEMAASTADSVAENNLTEFKKYMDNPDNEIQQYIGANGISYTLTMITARL